MFFHTEKNLKINFHSGFSLMELLVVISIIGILASVGLASLNDARVSAQYTVAQQEMKVIADAISVAGSANQSLIQITGSTCSMCYCRDEQGFGADLRNIPESTNCYQYWQSAIQTFAALSPLLDETGEALRDPWGTPYLLDENENEPGFAEPCRPDTLQSAGADGIYSMTLDSDDYLILLPFRTRVCRGNNDAFFFNSYGGN